MYSLHAVSIPWPLPQVFFGKGLHDEASIRSRLTPEQAKSAQIVLGEPVADRRSLDVRYLVLLESLKHDYPRNEGLWWPVPGNCITLYLVAAMRSTGTRPKFVSSAEALIRFRQELGLDQGVLAAILGTDTSRVSRLEKGKSKFTFDDFRTLAWWSGRLRVTSAFMAAFPIAPDTQPVEATLKTETIT